MFATAAIVSTVATLAGAGISAYSSYQAGQAQKEMSEYNARIAQDAAENEALAGAENAQRQREQSRRQLATMRTKMAGSGVNIGIGSALDVLGESAEELELATLDAFRDSSVRQSQLQSKASMSLYEGKQAAQAGTTGAFGSLLSGIGSAGSGIARVK